MSVLIGAAHAHAGSLWASGGQARTLYGVTIGENASYALGHLGLKPSRWRAASAGQPQPEIEYRVALADYGKALLALVFDSRIHIIRVYSNGTEQPDISDPYGVHVNDSVARLTKKRGRPTTIDSHHDYVYGPWSQMHWVYETNSGKVTSIAVSDGELGHQ